MKQKKIYKTKEESYQHFKDRLKERYGLTIEWEQYQNLHLKFKLLYVLSRSKRFGYVIINNELVYCIYNRTTSCILTCLSDEKILLPVPLYYKNRLVTKEQFGKHVNEAMYAINKLSDEMKANGDYAYFFKNRPHGFPIWVYSAAYSKADGKQSRFDFNRIVKNLYVGVDHNDIKNGKLPWIKSETI